MEGGKASRVMREESMWMYETVRDVCGDLLLYAGLRTASSIVIDSLKQEGKLGSCVDDFFSRIVLTQIVSIDDCRGGRRRKRTMGKRRLLLLSSAVQMNKVTGRFLSS